MSRTTSIILGAAVAAVAVVAVLLVWKPFDTAPAIQTKAIGTWREQTAADPVRVAVSSADGQGGTPRYWVTVSGTSGRPLPGRLEGDQIVVREQDTQDVLWDIGYDPGADALLITRPDTGERHVLRRVSR
jgi:hypothetical protein